MVKILLFSGGLDSFVLAKTIKFDKLIYVNLGTEDNKKEWERIKNIKWNAKLIKVDFSLSQWELTNKIIPYRNHILALIGAQYGNEIYIGATAGDTTKDKDYIFKSQMEGIMNYFSLDKHKVNVQEYPYILKMPLKEMTKKDIVKLYLDKANSLTSDLWKISRSCYNGKDKECGKCRSCLRKYVALKLNYIYEDGIFENNPKEYMNQFLEESKKKGRKQEIKDIKEVVEK